MGGALPTLCILCPKTAFFCPKRRGTPVKPAKRRQTVATLYMCLDCPVTKSPFLISSSTICPRNGPKRAKKGVNVHRLCHKSPKPRAGRILGYVAPKPVPRAPSLATNPTFLCSRTLRIPQRDAQAPVSVVIWWKMAKNGLNVRCLCQTSPKPTTGLILGYVAQNRIPRPRSPPASPHFLRLLILKMAQRDA